MSPEINADWLVVLVPVPVLVLSNGPVAAVDQLMVLTPVPTGQLTVSVVEPALVNVGAGSAATAIGAINTTVAMVAVSMER